MIFLDKLNFSKTSNFYFKLYWIISTKIVIYLKKIIFFPIIIVKIL